MQPITTEGHLVKAASLQSTTSRSCASDTTDLAGTAESGSAAEPSVGAWATPLALFELLESGHFAGVGAANLIWGRNSNSRKEGDGESRELHF
ncbi:hypothetical protein AJ79_01298 [Helicocarpus griseus UAMH5409]|uniref:Uncharacterized protein n=1 Tax=Helicocarpus griseus UAMH5409 TaxID=1447875 RepID=A0A2B7Y7H7_9EURO|nr:hypothetical protein AJ79_01298 [Helicocarpus griseus UAMH5409]